MNLTLMNKVRTKFAQTYLPHTLWGEAVHASAYELSISPTSAVQNRTPASVWFGENDLIQTKGIWLTGLYAEVITRNQTGTPCEIDDNGGGYSLWDPLDKIVSSRDITFS
ncbi:hypothetical protein PR048_000178 [Dryococelus australis]|uniref:Uncharacterized protein n=1 Tax=Dryococelus australis TaxID=614101 RepID=A0ABQ9IE35_9NEOP|nr:hypothetical protein PR048_000178 [Dryococelus australis]